jgi:hypothetical protein
MLLLWLCLPVSRRAQQLKKEWPAFSAADKQHCVTLAKTGGESSNTELLTCLEMSRDVRALRSAGVAASGGDLTKPASSLSMPMAEPTPAELASQPIPTKEVPKSEGETARKEVEQAKADAQTAQHPKPMPSVSLLTLRRLYGQQRRNPGEQERKRNRQRRTHKQQGILRQPQSASSQMLKQPDRQPKRPADRVLAAECGSGLNGLTPKITRPQGPDAVLPAASRPKASKRPLAVRQSPSRIGIPSYCRDYQQVLERPSVCY